MLSPTIQIDFLKQKLVNIFNDIFQTLGYTHSATIYYNAFAVALREEKIPYESKRVIPIIYKDTIIGSHETGMIIDCNFIVKFENFFNEDSMKQQGNKNELILTNCPYEFYLCLKPDVNIYLIDSTGNVVSKTSMNKSNVAVQDNKTI